MQLWSSGNHLPVSRDQRIEATIEALHEFTCSVMTTHGPIY